jgi:hypothetical protein
MENSNELVRSGVLTVACDVVYFFWCFSCSACQRLNYTPLNLRMTDDSIMGRIWKEAASEQPRCYPDVSPEELRKTTNNSVM